MRKPLVFVSSTCYDLRAVRADLRDSLESAGLEPKLSEYSSFPIDPDTNTIENCLRVVKDQADIFILIVGSRYGSLTSNGKSITNLEYLTARAKSIPIYVFVQKSILDIVPVWKDNPKGDFSSVSDSPKLFEFVSEIRDVNQKWVFSFNDAREIIETLRLQLAYLFSDALKLRKQVSGLSSLRRYDNLSGEELRLVIEKPKAWEYHLFSCAFRRELNQCNDTRLDWSYDIALGFQKRLQQPEFGPWIQERISGGQLLATNMNKLITAALPVALGPPGKPGDADHILYVASRFGAMYRAALGWKLDFTRTEVGEPFGRLKALTGSFLDEVVKEFDDFVSRLEMTVSELNSKTGVIELTFAFKVPDQIEFYQEVERVSALIKGEH